MSFFDRKSQFIILITLLLIGLFFMTKYQLLVNEETAEHKRELSQKLNICKHPDSLDLNLLSYKIKKPRLTKNPVLSLRDKSFICQELCQLQKYKSGDGRFNYYNSQFEILITPKKGKQFKIHIRRNDSTTLIFIPTKINPTSHYNILFTNDNIGNYLDSLVEY